MQRLQKIIAQAGVTSRRKAEELILAGRVAVNGHIISELGAKADPERDRITLDARPLRRPVMPQYWLFYKPRGVVSTLDDPQRRKHVGEWFPARRGERLYPVGRLDYHSEGLMLFTNDGALAERVLKAGRAFPKIYWVKVAGRPSEAQLEKLRRGIMLADPNHAQRTAPAEIRWLAAVPGKTSPRAVRQNHKPQRSEANPWLEVTLSEGRKNQIRRMFQSVGHPVEKLRRVRIGTLSLGQLNPGEKRPLQPDELARMWNALKPVKTSLHSPRTPAVPRRLDRPHSRRRE